MIAQTAFEVIMDFQGTDIDSSSWDTPIAVIKRYVK
jgi:hypothetical protein